LATDLALLDNFRATFSTIDVNAFTIIKSALYKHNDCVVTKRKTQQSIIDKLRRQTKLRLPQMQDLAGCRIVLQSGLEQARQYEDILVTTFNQQQWQVESKKRSTDEYNAIHIIAKQEKKFYEIQLKTYAQDIWANLVESMSNEKNTLKYGGNSEEKDLKKRLQQLSVSLQSAV